MSMNPEPENFDNLLRALALKRYEQPPPRYFHEFSGRIIARLRAGERGQWQETSFWLQSLWAFLDTRPALAAGFGAALVAVVISGITFSDRLSSGQAPLLPDQFAIIPPAQASALQPVIEANTNNQLTDLFKEIAQPPVVPVKWTGN